MCLHAHDHARMWRSEGILGELVHGFSQGFWRLISSSGLRSKPLYLMTHFASPTLGTLRSQTFSPNVAPPGYTLMTLPAGSGAWGVNESIESLLGA